MANEYYNEREEKLKRLERLSNDFQDAEQEVKDREWLKEQREAESWNCGGI